MESNLRKIILLCGFPRSGTTWFANLLNSHPSIFYRHEIIGRSNNVFSQGIFDALKINHGLEDRQYESLIETIAEANIDTDKPPFFDHGDSFLQRGKTHHYLWLLTKAFPLFSPVYKRLLKVPNKYNSSILIKETRSTVDMKSIICGLRPAIVIFLVRQPLGAIASHIKGIELGTMGSSTSQNRLQWFKNYCNRAYILEMGIDEERILKLPECEYLALGWRFYHEDVLELLNFFPSSKVCTYEGFVRYPLEQTKNLFNSLNIELSSQTSDFILDSTTHKLDSKSIYEKDSSHSYYSVFQGPGFNTEKYKDQLSIHQQTAIQLHTKDVYKSILQNESVKT